eukprot:Em0001g365a
MRGSGAYFTAICSPYCLLYLSPFPSLTTSLDPLQSSVLDHTDVILKVGIHGAGRLPADLSHATRMNMVSSTRQELLPSLCIVEHQQQQALYKEFCQQLVGTRYLGQYSYPQQMYDISHDARGKENLISSLVTVHITLLSSSIPQATPSSFNMLAELEAYRHKRDEAAQQNEAPVAGSVEGQSVPVKIETLVGKVVQFKTVQPYWRQQPWKESVPVQSCSTVEHQQLQALHEEFCQQLVGIR